MFDRRHILEEIKRTAKANGGVPLGWRKFQTETGKRSYDWQKYWARWGEAQEAAGLAPNVLTRGIGEEAQLEAFIALIRELGRFPAVSDLTVKHTREPNFPTEKTYRRFGGQNALASRVLQYCSGREGYDDVTALCEARANTTGAHEIAAAKSETSELGYVYLLRSGRNYKIGKTNAVGRRERELAIQLPERTNVVHEIKTDDPDGIEAYWHRRFAPQRKNGEWFALNAADVQAFKRRKFM
jgi:hypothetical protein